MPVMDGITALPQILKKSPTTKVIMFSTLTEKGADITLKALSLGAVECMVKPSPDVYPDLWNDLWMKKYATALVKTQWGRNLTKYNQVNLPGGITMNGDQIYQQATDEIREIEQFIDNHQF